MKKIGLLLLLLFLLLAYGFEVQVVEIHFSPSGGCTQAIIQQIDQAQREIKIMIYSFTSQSIATALLQAFNRGIHVEIIIDEGNDRSRYSQTPFLRQNGITVYVDGKETIHHNKVTIIDQKIVITGSFNFSKAAESSNAENLIILDSVELAKVYLENYKLHKNHSYLLEEEPKEYKPQETPESTSTQDLPVTMVK